MNRPHLRPYLRTVAVIGLAACSSGPSEPESNSGDLEVAIVTTGEDADESGYRLVVGSRTPIATAASDTVRVEGLPAGSVTLRLDDVAANCTVAAPHPRTVDVEPGRTAHTSLGVSCIENTGAVQVTVGMSGPVLDGSGYSIAVGDQVLAVTANPATLLFVGVPVGEYVIQFHDLASYCSGPADARVEIRPGALTSTVVAVECEYSVRGRILFSASPHGADAYRLYTVAPDGSDLVPFGDHSTVFRSQLRSSASADGSRVVFNYGMDIYALDGDGTNLRPIPNGTDGRTPQVSPDGERIAFSREGEIWVMDFDGSNAVQVTDALEGENFTPSWSRDGLRLAFENHSPSNDWNVYTVDLAGGTPQLITPGAPGDDLDPAWAPDGSRLAFSSDRDGASYIVSTLPDGSDLTLLAQDGSDPYWSPDGNRIAFHVDGFGHGVYVYDASSGEATLITSDLPDGDLRAVHSFWVPAAP